MFKRLEFLLSMLIMASLVWAFTQKWAQVVNGREIKLLRCD